MKYKVGDELIVKVRVAMVDETGSDDLPYLVEFDEDSGDWIGEKELDTAIESAAAYAAKAAPVTAPDGWGPRPGDKVLVEALYTGSTARGDVTIAIPYHGSDEQVDCVSLRPMWVSRSAIVGPAPARAMFAVGQEVFSVSELCVLKIVRAVEDGVWRVSNHVSNCLFWKDNDLITIEEAKKLLEAK